MKLFVSSCTVLLFAALTCCTSVDDSLGTSLLPAESDMETLFLDLRGSDVGNTYVTFRDTMNTSNQAFFLLGKMKSDTFGMSKFAHLGQFMPYERGQDDEDFGFGSNTVADSIFMHFTWSYARGDRDVEQTFYVYELDKPIDIDVNFRNDVKYEDFLGDLLFEFKFKGTPTYGAADSMRLEPTTAGCAFMDKLIADTTLFYDFGKFHEAFDGMAIIPADTSPDDAAVYYVSSQNSFFKLWMHNYKPENLSEVNETVTWGFHFSNVQTYTSPNKSVASIRHDYTGTPIAPLIADTTQVSQTMYIHTPVGVTGKLEIGEDVYDRLNGFATGEYRGIFINRALLHIYMQDDGLDFLNSAPVRLGSYTNFALFTPIADYNFVLEASASGTVLAYDGYLTRTHGFYNLNITSYLQQALIDKDQRLPITFGPEYFSSLSVVTGVALDGCGGNRPIELSIIYTLMK